MLVSFNLFTLFLYTSFVFFMGFIIAAILKAGGHDE
jgi:hypothetical protein